MPQANRDNAQSIIDHLLSLLASPPVDAEAALPDAAASLLSISGGSAVASSARPSSQTSLLSPSYRLTLTKTILAIGSADTFAAVPNYVWYLSVLIDLAYIARVDVGREIRAQIVEIVGRVRDVRPSAVELLGKVLHDANFLESAANGWEGVQAEGGERSWGEVLAAAAWVCGEYAEFLPSAPQTAMLLLEPDVARLAPGVQAVCVHGAAKVFAFWAAQKAAAWDASAESGDVVEVGRVLEKLVASLCPFLASSHAEVMERAAEVGNLFAFVTADLKHHKPGRQASASPPADEEVPSAEDKPAGPAAPSYPKSLLLLAPLFTSHPLPPVSTRAQGSIAVPEGLDLGRPLFDFSAERAAEAADESEESEDEPLLAPVRREILRPETNAGGRVRTKEEDELLRVVAASGGRVKKPKGKGKAREGEDPEERKRVRRASRVQPASSVAS
jgi:AP-3 complex subunit delta-1